MDLTISLFPEFKPPFAAFFAFFSSFAFPFVAISLSFFLLIEDVSALGQYVADRDGGLGVDRFAATGEVDRWLKIVGKVNPAQGDFRTDHAGYTFCPGNTFAVLIKLVTPAKVGAGTVE